MTFQVLMKRLEAQVGFLKAKTMGHDQVASNYEETWYWTVDCTLDLEDY